MQRWHLLSRSPPQDCLSNGSNGQTKQDLVVPISFASKFKPYKSLVTSILLYGCETWTLLADSEKRIQAFETKYLRKLIRISYLKHKTNNWVRSKINFPCGSTGTSHGSGMPHATRASSKPFFIRALWRLGDAVVGRGNAGWTISNSGHSCPRENCSQGLLQQGTELN